MSSITFYGAAGEVTGSCALVKTGHSTVLVDCGLFQGRRFAEDRNALPFAFDPKDLDAVILTHAHMDHCGRLPLLVQAGYRGPIFTTAATADLATVMLTDSAKVMQREAVRRGKKPLYTTADVVALQSHWRLLPYRTRRQILPDVAVQLYDAGHILGSTFVQVTLLRGSEVKTLVMSGDLGNPPAPIVSDTEFIAGADYVVIESTYGGRIHEPADVRLELLQQAVTESIGRGGVLMIPAFALERTQEVLYELNHLIEQGIVPRVPVYVDSPLAIAANAVYRRYVDLYDPPSRKLILSGDDIFNFPGLIYTRSVAESKKINDALKPKVILAGSGMLVGGRITHHLKRYLPDPHSHLLIISYQPAGGLGRRLLEGAKRVEIDGQLVTVRAKVTAIGAYSSHADQPKLLHWVKSMTDPKPKLAIIVHGEPKPARMLADGLQQKLGISGIVPKFGQTIVLP